MMTKKEIIGMLLNSNIVGYVGTHEKRELVLDNFQANEVLNLMHGQELEIEMLKEQLNSIYKKLSDKWVDHCQKTSNFYLGGQSFTDKQVYNWLKEQENEA